jgi:hypothetical protein
MPDEIANMTADLTGVSKSYIGRISEWKTSLSLLRLSVRLIGIINKIDDVQLNSMVFFMNYRVLTQCAAIFIGWPLTFREISSIVEAVCSTFHRFLSQFLRLLLGTFLSFRTCSGRSVLASPIPWHLHRCLYSICCI